MKLDLFSNGKGSCCKCGAETEYKLIRYCEECFESEQKRIDSEERIQKRSMLLSSSGIPRKMRDNGLDSFLPTYNQKKAISLLTNQIESYGTETSWQLPYLYGSPGTGKTLIAIASCIEFINRRNASVKYIHVPDIMIDNEFYKENKSMMQSCQMLVLDDIGHHNTNQYSINMLYNIINYRLMNQMGVMIISNFSVEELTYKLSKDNDKINDMTCVALRDRIMEMCLPIEIKEENIRIRKAIKRTKDRYKHLGI